MNEPHPGKATDHGPSRHRPATGGPARPAGLRARLAESLAARGVSVEALANGCLRLRGVPLSDEFSKERANLLLRPVGSGVGHRDAIEIYVDEDLAYHGDDPVLREALQGETVRGWRALRLQPVHGPFDQAVCTWLEILRSPIQADCRRAADADSAAAPTREPRRDSALGRVAEPVAPETLAEAYRTSFRTELADGLAGTLTRPAPPQSIILWGESGVGKRHLLLALAWPLLETGRVDEVVLVSGAQVASGCLFRPEIDSALQKVLAEAEAEPRRLLLIRDLDLCLTRSPVGRSLLIESLDRGLAFAATVQRQRAARWKHDADLARRLLATPVPTATLDETLRAAHDFARRAGVEVPESTLRAAVRESRRRGGGQPGAAIGLLSAAIAQAAWKGPDHVVSPDDVLAAPEAVWPHDHPATGNRKE
jgi:hypothetical protein